ncbi:MAG: 2-C-methyl-D-erythritol 2,4-cyclodiphosphate synthase [Spirochaetaceae bacterium]|nr:MAG: 2-C-methyl-D-erythritol 2,4-cyclodiphosphate synthase [Spirochaetaceae bacterium]
MRIGFGYDSHRLVPGRTLILGGVSVPNALGPEAHSDGDVLIHALIDALLGACALGDIGRLFPPSDERYRDISSRILLARTLEVLSKGGFRPRNVDATIVLESPRLSPYIEQMRSNLSQDMGIPATAISVKAKTKEGLGLTGQGRAVEAYAVALVEED